MHVLKWKSPNTLIPSGDNVHSIRPHFFSECRTLWMCEKSNFPCFFCFVFLNEDTLSHLHGRDSTLLVQWLLFLQFTDLLLLVSHVPLSLLPTFQSKSNARLSEVTTHLTLRFVFDCSKFAHKPIEISIFKHYASTIQVDVLLKAFFSVYRHTLIKSLSLRIFTKSITIHLIWPIHFALDSIPFSSQFHFERVRNSYFEWTQSGCFLLQLIHSCCWIHPLKWNRFLSARKLDEYISSIDSGSV